MGQVAGGGVPPQGASKVPVLPVLPQVLPLPNNLEGLGFLKRRVATQALSPIMKGFYLQQRRRRSRRKRRRKKMTTGMLMRSNLPRGPPGRRLLRHPRRGRLRPRVAALGVGCTAGTSWQPAQPLSP